MMMMMMMMKMMMAMMILMTMVVLLMVMMILCVGSGNYGKILTKADQEDEDNKDINNVSINRRANK